MGDLGYTLEDLGYTICGTVGTLLKDLGYTLGNLGDTFLKLGDTLVDLRTQLFHWKFESKCSLGSNYIKLHLELVRLWSGSSEEENMSVE